MGKYHWVNPGCMFCWTMSVYQSVSSDSAAMTFFWSSKGFGLRWCTTCEKGYVNSPSQKGILTAELPGIESKETFLAWGVVGFRNVFRIYHISRTNWRLLVRYLGCVIQDTWTCSEIYSWKLIFRLGPFQSNGHLWVEVPPVWITYSWVVFTVKFRNEMSW